MMSESKRLPGATHLECTGTGQRVESEQLVGLSEAGKPLFARYDLEAIKVGFTREAVGRRQADLWRYEEVLPVRDRSCAISLLVRSEATRRRTFRSVGERLSRSG